MDSNSTWLCRLCLQQSTDVVNIFDNYKTRTIASILTQHFWFQVSKDDGFSECLCQVCWINTKTFHIFYETLELFHKDYWNSVKFAETNFSSDFIKQEPSDLALELDLNLVKSEETEPRAPWSILEISEAPPLDFSSHQSETKPTPSKDKDKDQSPNAKLTKKCNGSDKEVETKMFKSDRKRKYYEFQRKKECEDAQIREYFTMECDLCGHPFETFRNAKRHYRVVHKVDGYLICCGRKFVYRSATLRHINYHLNPDAHSCDQCGRRFADKKALAGHIQNHEPISSRAFKCDLCPKSFPKEYRLATHKQFVHCPVKCSQCDMSYPSKSKLTTHIKNAHQSKVTATRVCDICGKDFVNKYTLLIHMQEKHSTIENPEFQCDICGTWIKHKTRLRKHMEWHREDPIECSLCSKVLQNKLSLARHIRYVHSEKRHRCTICDKAFRTRLSLKEHTAGHTGQDLYECAYCSKTFKSSANMYSHRKKMHLAEYAQDSRKRISIFEKMSVT